MRALLGWITLLSNYWNLAAFRSNMERLWCTAEVVKVRLSDADEAAAGDDKGKKRRKSKGSEGEGAIESVDLRYADGIVDKKVPLVLRERSSIKNPPDSSAAAAASASARRAPVSALPPPPLPAAAAPAQAGSAWRWWRRAATR